MAVFIAPRGLHQRRAGQFGAADGEQHAVDLGGGHRHVGPYAVQVDFPRMARRLGGKQGGEGGVGILYLTPVVVGRASGQCSQQQQAPAEVGNLEHGRHGNSSAEPGRTRKSPCFRHGLKTSREWCFSEEPI